MNLFDFVPGYSDKIFETGREAAFIMLLAFVMTFLLTRFYTRMARKTGWGSTFIGHTHVHHLVFGLVILLVAGALEFSLADASGGKQLALAALFGFGAAFVLDEFALIFHLRDVYWEEEGRKSIDAVIVGTIFGIIFLLGITPLGTTEDLASWALAGVIVFNLVFVVTAALKGKIYMSIFGLFIPLLAMTASIRLAEPWSIWARRYYKPDSNKLKRSEKRYKHYEQVWRPRKAKLHDLLGGKVHH
jgi:lysyl-tRNA synthetase class 2